MDEDTLNELRDLAEANGIDPEQILAIAEADGLPDDLRRAIADIMGDLTAFGRAANGPEQD